MNDSNILVGYVNSGEAEEGFYAYKGHFSAPFREPDDTGQQTLPSGINNQRHICGSYWDSASFGFKGFVESARDMFLSLLQARVTWEIRSFTPLTTRIILSAFMAPRRIP
jgi:hypothetical protein